MEFRVLKGQVVVDNRPPHERCLAPRDERPPHEKIGAKNKQKGPAGIMVR